MKSQPFSDKPTAPAGLKHNRGYRTRLWIRPESMTFRRLFAVHFTAMADGVHRTAFPVAGYLGSFAFDWHDPDHARKLLVGQRLCKHSRQILGSLMDDSTGEWLLCNQPDAAAAVSCVDADFVAQGCLHSQSVKGGPGVYFISNGRNAVKIGKAGTCINSRFVNLQIASPDTLRIVAVIADPDPGSLEDRLHAMLADRRIRGEWFAISDAEAISLAIENGGRALRESSC